MLRRPRVPGFRRAGCAAVVAAVLLSSCTTTPEVATPSTTAAVSTSSAASTTSGAPVETAEPSGVPTVTVTESGISAAPSSYTPAADADPVDGDCPYLDKAQVQEDTGQRMGSPKVRPADPQPVCEFVRNDGAYLATVRVLELPTPEEAVSAVDFYVPRDRSNPETKPAGWTGGSMPTDAGTMVAVSKDRWAVIAETNQQQSVYARLLVTHAIETLGI